MHSKREFNQDNGLEIFSDLSTEFLLAEEVNSIVELIDDDIFDEMLSTGLENPNSSEVNNRNTDDIMDDDLSESFLYDFVGEDVIQKVDKKEILNFICNKKYPEDKVDALMREINEDATQNMTQRDSGQVSMQNQELQNPYYYVNINQVITEQKPVCDLYHLRRNKPTVFSVFYSKPSNLNSWILTIELIPESDAGNRGEALRVCSNDKHNFRHWFTCNETQIPIGSGYQTLLVNNRCEKSVSIKFPCNSSCTSMYTKAILQFKIIDYYTGNNIHLQQFKIRVSERPARDARDNLERLLHQSTNMTNNNTLDYMNYVQFINDPYFINKEIPKLFDYIVPGYNFNIQLVKKDDFNCDANKFAESDGKLISLKVNYPQRPLNGNQLFFRCMIVDPKFPEKPIVCNKHHVDHILRCNEDNVTYVGSQHGVYADERLAVKIPFRSEFSLYYTCKNSCFVERNRKYAGLIVILENEHGQMLARRVFKFAIIIRPKRSNLNYDHSDDEDFITEEIQTKKRRIMSPEMQ